MSPGSLSDVQVAADPGDRRPVQNPGTRQAVVERVAGSAQEDEMARPHGAVLEDKAFRFTPCIEMLDVTN
ncbi:hypothetical protein TPL01_20500 [Sulfuriferula plumbiphila]|uniref:Uncharacterized protein n=1 Tax=Sulfuriferula plumbiphila TaxID=171865 RepID=A0A512L8W6_9PROT|nr:hypothetical protein [Sulfuriferula plumbiphila]BBP04258.1 hypothetical protein SFPGR_16800 [Sulfuriferula plumbiphila]GEP30912.1 hypothetical protein TPL01_20500 [Sulfuriferula plumbiphila]